MGGPLDIVKELPGYEKRKFAYLAGVAALLLAAWLVTHVDDIRKTVDALGSDLEVKVSQPELVPDYAKKKYGITPIDMDATPPVFSPFGAEISVSVLNKGKNLLPLKDIKVVDSRSGKELRGFSVRPNIRSNAIALEAGKSYLYVLSAMSLRPDAADAILNDALSIVVEAGREKPTVAVIGYTSDQPFDREAFLKSRTPVPDSVINALKNKANVLHVDKESGSRK